MKLCLAVVLAMFTPCSKAVLCENENLMAACSEVHGTVLDVEGANWSGSNPTQKAILSVDLEAGTRVLLCDEPRLGGRCVRRSRADVQLDHNVGGFVRGVRSAEVTTDRPLWSSARYTASYPNDQQGLEWGDDEAQGVAHDETHWYVTERAHLARIPITEDLKSNRSDDRTVGLPGGCRHFGDPVYSQWDRLLYVPLERCPAADGSTERRIVGYDEDLVPRRAATLGSAAHAAWVAVHPRTGYLVTAATFDSVTSLDVYANVFADGERIHPLYSIRLLDPGGRPMTVTRVQGGEFSENGRLYLSSDDRSGAAGIYVFDVEGRTATLLTRFGPNGLRACQEVEGLTVWDTDGLGIRGVTGQIHWILYSQKRFACGDSNLWFKHVRVSEPEGL